LDCAGIAIIDNAAQRPLNIVEQSRAITLINQYAQRASDASRLADLAGLPAGKRAVDRIEPLSAMSSNLQHAILEGSVALPVALLIHQLPCDDATSLCDLFRLINTGLNVQRELLGLISDISRRDDTPIPRLLQAPDVTAILNDADAPMPQRVNRFRRLLKTARFPELSAAEARFRKQLKALKLAPQIQFLPPPFFEGTSFRLAMTIGSKRQLRSLKHEIDKLADHLDLLPD
jgi:ParB family chromosome partitioning protein